MSYRSPHASAEAIEAARIRSLGNQFKRTIAAVELSIDALTPAYRVLILNHLLREALNDLAEQEQRRQGQSA